MYLKDYGFAALRYAAKFDPFLSLDCASGPPPWRNPRKGRDQILLSGNLAQEEEREGDDPPGEPDPQDSEERLHQEVVGVEHHLVGAEVAAGIAAVQQEGRNLQVISHRDVRGRFPFCTQFAL